MVGTQDLEVGTQGRIAAHRAQYCGGMPPSGTVARSGSAQASPEGDADTRSKNKRLLTLENIKLLAEEAFMLPHTARMLAHRPP